MTRPAVAVVAFALALAPPLAAAQARDIPWWARNHAERRAMLEWCAVDAARRATNDCRNARAAGAVELMTPNHPWRRAAPPPSPRPQPRPAPAAPKPSAPAGRGPMRAA